MKEVKLAAVETGVFCQQIGVNSLGRALEFTMFSYVRLNKKHWGETRLSQHRFHMSNLQLCPASAHTYSALISNRHPTLSLSCSLIMLVTASCI